MKNVGNSSDGRSQGVPKISGHPCIGRMVALRGHLCDSTAFLLEQSYAPAYVCEKLTMPNVHDICPKKDIVFRILVGK